MLSSRHTALKVCFDKIDPNRITLFIDRRLDERMCITNIMYKLVSHRTAQIRYKKHPLNVLVADTQVKQMLGLMHRKSIKTNEGMLLIFNRENFYGIWMPNMRFPIDIIWLNGKRVVVDLVKNAKPCRSIISCEVYKPKKPAMYVLEVNSGVIDRLGVREGGRFSL